MNHRRLPRRKGSGCSCGRHERKSQGPRSDSANAVARSITEEEFPTWCNRRGNLLRAPKAFLCNGRICNTHALMTRQKSSVEPAFARLSVHSLMVAHVHHSRSLFASLKAHLREPTKYLLWCQLPRCQWWRKWNKRCSFVWILIALNFMSLDPSSPFRQWWRWGNEARAGGEDRFV